MIRNFNHNKIWLQSLCSSNKVVSQVVSAEKLRVFKVVYSLAPENHLNYHLNGPISYDLRWIHFQVS